MHALKENLSKSFSAHEIELLRYTWLCFLYESSKFIIMFAFFSLLHLQKEFCIAVLVLLTIRNFYGGIHFEHYLTCFGFTFGFFATSLILAEHIILQYGVQIVILFLCLAISGIIRPITSNNRPDLPQHMESIYHLAGMILLSAYTILLIIWKTFPYRNICFWVIVLQTLQLLAARIFQKGDVKG